MVMRYFEGVIPETSPPQEMDQRLQEVSQRVQSHVAQHMDEVAFHRALTATWELINACNKYIDESAPWSLAKNEKDKPRLGTVLYHALESLRLIALLLAPFMPATSETMWVQLGLEDDLWKQNFNENGKWGGLKPGRKIAKPAPLFPRIDPSKMSFE